MQPQSRGSRPRATSSFPSSSPTWGCSLESGPSMRPTSRSGRPLLRRIAVMDWSFGGLWPYEPRWFDSEDGRMHFVDEGPRDGRPVVLLHGNPTWSFLYRNFIPSLVDAGHRAIAVDHLGFGRSDKPDQAELYTIERHCRRLDALLESLDLRDATVVPQDWGGPIGLWWATRHPERLRGLFVLNTFAHRPPERVKLPLPLRLFRTPGVGEVMVKGLDAFKRGLLFRVGVVKRERITPEVRRAYLAPHPSWSSRTPILVFPRQIPSGPQGEVSDLLAELEARAVGCLRDEAHLDLAGLVEIGLDLPLWADVPAEHDPVGRLVCEHASPAALAAVDATVIDVAAHVGLEDGLGDLDLEHVVLAWLEGAEADGEDGEGALDGRLDDDRVPGCGVGCLRGHSLSFACCSTAVL